MSRILQYESSAVPTDRTFGGIVFGFGPPFVRGFAVFPKVSSLLLQFGQVADALRQLSLQVFGVFPLDAPEVVGVEVDIWNLLGGEDVRLGEVVCSADSARDASYYASDSLVKPENVRREARMDCALGIMPTAR